MECFRLRRTAYRRGSELTQSARSGRPRPATLGRSLLFAGLRTTSGGPPSRKARSTLPRRMQMLAQ
jgi:hypothetical protein